MNIDYTNYIKPELLVLIPVLVFAGYGMKQSEAVKDKYIPDLLAAAGVVLAALYVLATTTLAVPQDWFMALFTALVQGLLCAGGAVLANQTYKQSKKDE